MANVLAAVPLGRATFHGNEHILTPIGRIELAHTYFDDDASERLFDEMDYQRATQAYIWSRPLVGMTTWRDRHRLAFGVTNETDFVVLESLKDKRGIVTSDLTMPSLINFISLESGALEIAYPDGGNTPFRREKATNWEGAFRVPLVMRWPGVIKPGTIVNNICAHEDLLPTFLAAAGDPDIVDVWTRFTRRRGVTSAERLCP
jgi:arylsulfatase A-like enzyme